MLLFPDIFLRHILLLAVPVLALVAPRSSNSVARANSIGPTWTVHTVLVGDGNPRPVTRWYQASNITACPASGEPCWIDTTPFTVSWEGKKNAPWRDQRWYDKGMEVNYQSISFPKGSYQAEDVAGRKVCIAFGIPMTALRVQNAIFGAGPMYYGGPSDILIPNLSMGSGNVMNARSYAEEFCKKPGDVFFTEPNEWWN